MARRLRRRLRELEEIALNAQVAAAHSAQRARDERLRAEERELALRVQAERDTNNVRQAFDDALERAGVVLFQQSTEGTDCFYVSASMQSILGWSPPSFLRHGALRGIVHPDDLRAFNTVVQAMSKDPTSTRDRDAAPTAQGFEKTELIDLTAQADRLVSEIVQPRRPSEKTVDGSTYGHSADPLGEDRTATGPVEHDADDASRSEPIVRFRSAEGTWVRMAVRPDVPLDDGAGQVLAGALITVEAAHTELAVAEWFTKLVQNDPAGCMILEFADSSDPLSLTIRATNRAAQALFNLDGGPEHDLPLEDLLVPSSAQLLRSSVFDVHHTGQTVTVERLSLPEIPGMFLDMRVIRLDDGAVGVVFKDVTSIVTMESRLRKQASHDALTGLPSRSLLEERLDPAAATASADNPVAVILVDIVGLGRINEDYGLNHGDDLLRQVGERLVRDVSGLSVIARFGDDEFALVTHGCCSADETIEVARSVLAHLGHPFDIRGHLVDVDFSIGMAIAPDHGHDARTLLRNASSALRDAKHSADGLVVFNQSSDAHSNRRLAILNELRDSLANDRLELHFQPQLDLRSGRVHKVEAMPRWTEEHHGSTSMSVELLELAEQSALIQPLTRWLVTEATLASRELQRSLGRTPGDGSDLVVSVNLSPRNLFDPELEAFLDWMVKSGELQPGQLEFEINEPGLMDDPSASQETLERLSRLGINFVVDEFGTGYTSLATMQHLPVTGLKIDRSYLVSIAAVPSDAAVIRSTIELSHELGLFTAATGVTDLDVLSMLVDFGCDFAQGPFLSDPIPMKALPDRIAEIESVARAWLGADMSI